LSLRKRERIETVDIAHDTTLKTIDVDRHTDQIFACLRIARIT
jgi:hypothetical protein